MAGSLTPTTPSSSSIVVPQFQYLGAYASAPTTRPNGSTLQSGDFYFNETTPQVLTWDAVGAAWVATSVASTAAASAAAALASEVAAAASAAAALASETAAAASAALIGSGGLANAFMPAVHIPFKRADDEIALSGVQTFTRASTATYKNPLDGVITSAAIDVPRFERMADGGVGVLMEGASTNLLTYSEQFDNAAWNKTNAPTTTANSTVAPDGNTTADTLEDADATKYCLYDQSATSFNSALPYTISIYILKDAIGRATRFPNLKLRFTGSTTESNNLDFDTSTGESRFTAASTNASASVESVGDWWRVSITATSTDAANTACLVQLYPAIGASSAWNPSTTAPGSIVVWGAQLEAQSFATSYIPTTTVAVTRAADILTLDVNNLAGYQDSMTIIVDYDSLGVDLSAGASYVLHAAGLTNIIMRSQSGASLKALGSFGAAGGGMLGNLATAGVVRRMAIKRNATDATYAEDGVAVASVVIGAPTGTVTNLYVGSTTAGVASLFGHIRNLRIYDRTLTDAEIGVA